MPEDGGPTTQSGMFFQNTVAAWYMARMLNDPFLDHEQNPIQWVRSEAPEAVDDVVVAFARGTYYVQVKQSLALSGIAWTKLWVHFRQQLQHMDASHDRLILWGRLHTPLFEDLEELTKRAGSIPDGPREQQLKEFFQKRMGKDLLVLLDKIASSLRGAGAQLGLPPEESAAHADAFTILRRMEVIVKGSAKEIQEAAVRVFLNNFGDPVILFDKLRDLAADGARTRGLSSSVCNWCPNAY